MAEQQVVKLAPFPRFNPWEETMAATPAASAAIVRRELLRHVVDQRFNAAIRRVWAG
jgi:hypothetical protein